MIKTTRPFINNLTRLATCLEKAESNKALDKAMSRVKNLERIAQNKMKERVSPDVADALTAGVYIQTAKFMSLVPDPQSKKDIVTRAANAFRTLMKD